MSTSVCIASVRTLRFVGLEGAPAAAQGSLLLKLPPLAATHPFSGGPLPGASRPFTGPILKVA